MCRTSWISGSLNLLEPSGPHRACYGIPLPLPFLCTVHLVWWLFSRNNSTCAKSIRHTLQILQLVWAHHTCHREAVFVGVITMLSTQHTEHAHAHDNTKDSTHNWASRISLDNHWQQVRIIKSPSSVHIVHDRTSFFIVF